MSTCSQPGCDRAVVARSLCRMHYVQEWRAGTLGGAPLSDRERHECGDDHPHDLATCWGEHGCRCARCQHLRRMDRQRRRNRLRAYGRDDEIRPPRVAAAPVRDHLVKLMAVGLGLDRISEAAQVSRSAVMDVHYGARDARRRDIAVREVRASYAQRLLAVTPADVVAPLVPSTGTVRRLRALVAIGYTESFLSSRLGMQVGNFNNLILGERERVTAATFGATSRLFSELWAVPASGRGVKGARTLARKRRWVGPLAWDDIDDPDERPDVKGASADGSAVDDIAIDLAVAGQAVKLSPVELREAVRRLHAMRWSDALIAETLHCTGRTVLRIRTEMGLQAFEYGDLRKAVGA